MENKEMKDRLENLKCVNGAMYFGSVEEPCIGRETGECCHNEQTYEEAISELQDFIQSEKDLAVAKREKDMANEIITFINSGHRCASDTGYSIDLNDVKDFIKNLITKHKYEKN